EDVEPRFYQISSRRFVLDIDIPPEAGMAAAIAAEEAAAKLVAETASTPAADGDVAVADAELAADGTQSEMVPTISTIGSTVRIAFPFEQDTPAAVFRRGDTVWMLFDTGVQISPLPITGALTQVARRLSVMPAGGTQIVRLDLASDRLATLGSEGRSW